MRRLILALAALIALASPARAVDIGLPMMGVGFSSGGAACGGYLGQGNIAALSPWVGLRAYSAATCGGNAIVLCSPSDVACETETTSATTGKLVLGTVGTACSNVSICTIKEFFDQSGSNNFIQTTIANRATFVVNCLNASYPCAKSTNAATIYLSTSSISSSQPYSAEGFVYRTATDANYGVIWSVGSGVFPALYFIPSTAALNISSNGSTISSNVTASSATWHQITAVFNSSSSVVRVDGTESTRLSAGTGALSGDVQLVGNAAVSTNSLTGEFTEIGTLTATMSSTVRASLESNACTFYAVAC